MGQKKRGVQIWGLDGPQQVLEPEWDEGASVRSGKPGLSGLKRGRVRKVRAEEEVESEQGVMVEGGDRGRSVAAFLHWMAERTQKNPQHTWFSRSKKHGEPQGSGRLTSDSLGWFFFKLLRTSFVSRYEPSRYVEESGFQGSPAKNVQQCPYARLVKYL